MEKRTSNGNNWLSTLVNQPQHIGQLEASGISSAVAKERRYRSLTDPATEVEYLKTLGINVGKEQVPGLLIPWWNVYGELSHYQYRPDKPRVIKDQVHKYENPKGQPNILDLHPRMTEQLADTSVPLVITEGVKKADAAVTRGLCCISLNGVWCWQYKGAPLGAWEKVPLRKRLVYAAPDGDALRNPQVRKAVHSMRAWLEGEGARVRILLFPDDPFGEKPALDSFLAEDHSVDELFALAVREVPEFFNQQGGFEPGAMAKHLKEQANLRLGEDDRLWRYEHGVYRPDGDKWVESQVRELLDEDFRRNRAAEVLGWCRAEQPSLRVSEDLRYINVRNGLLDWQGEKIVLRPHTPEVASMVQLPVEYHAKAKCPVVQKFLREVFPEDALWLALEMAGLGMVPDPRYRKAFMLLGSGSNGKSTYLELLEHLYGRENVSAHPLQDLGEDRFLAADLYGKLANICGELEPRALRRSGLFKRLTGGGDPVNAQHKFHHPFKFHPTARMFFSANEAPGTADQTDAFFDRWVVVPFPNKFTAGAGLDKDLPRKLSTPEELSGFLNLALAGLRKLHARGHFKLPPSVQAMGIKFRRDADTVAGFVHECCRLEASAVVGRSALYKEYRQWCRDSARPEVSAQRFNEHLPKISPVAEFKSGERKWRGIAVVAPRTVSISYDVQP
jgi:P4 family phage/plasmid primase-like protien